jgi:hypothetical protein
MMNEAGMEFYMYSSERFLSYGQSYLDEKVNKRAVEELQALKMAELEVLKRQQLIARSERQIESVGSNRRNIIGLKLRDLEDQLFGIEQKQKVLELEAKENPDAQEYINRLSIQRSALQEEFRKMQFEKLVIQEEIVNNREVEYEALLRRLRDKNR